MNNTIRNMLAGSLMAGTLVVGGTAIAAHPSALRLPGIASSSAQVAQATASPFASAQPKQAKKAHQATTTKQAKKAHQAAPPKQRAARELDNTYRRLGVLTTDGSLPASAQQLVDTTKRTYTDALNAYNSGDYEHSTALVLVAQTTAKAAQQIVRQERGTVTVPGVATPPMASQANAQQQAQGALEQADKRLNAARAAKSSDATVNDLIGQSSALYQQALDLSNAGKFEAAQHRANTAKKLAAAAERYNRALTQPAKPAASTVPASAAPSATEQSK